MKKTILAISFLFLTTMAFFAVPSYAQTAKDKANEINAAGKSAVQSQSTTESRGINNAAWDGSAKGGVSVQDGKKIDIIGGNTQSTQEDEKTSFDEPETKDVTPWKGVLIGLVSSMMSAFALLAAASLVAYHAKSFENHPQGYELSNKFLKIAAVMAAVAIAACVAAIALATVIMLKYKQYELGGIWLGGASVGLISGIALIATTRHLGGRLGWYNDNYNKIIGTMMAIELSLSILGICGGGYYAYRLFTQSTGQENTQQEQQDEKTSSSSAQVLNYRIG